MMNRTVRIRSLPTIIGGASLIAISLGLLVWIGMVQSAPKPIAAAPRVASRASVASPAPIAAAAITVVADPQAEIQKRISEKTGNTCFSTALVSRLLVPGDELDRQVASAGGDNRWLSKGERWVGSDPAAAVGAFGATW